jgi:hypothetical protein
MDVVAVGCVDFDALAARHFFALVIAAHEYVSIARPTPNESLAANFASVRARGSFVNASVAHDLSAEITRRDVGNLAPAYISSTYRADAQVANGLDALAVPAW